MRRWQRAQPAKLQPGETVWSQPCPNSWFSLPKLLISINISERRKAVNFPSSHSQFIASGGNKHHTFSTLDLPWAEQDLFYLDHTLCGVFIKQSTLKQSSAGGGLSWAIYWTHFGELVNLSKIWKWHKKLVKKMEDGVGKLGQSGLWKCCWALRCAGDCRTASSQHPPPRHESLLRLHAELSPFRVAFPFRLHKAKEPY